MTLVLFFFLGALVAATHTVSLAWNAKLYLSPNAAAPAVLMHLARFTLVLVMLIAFAWVGRGPFVAALAGFGCAHGALLSLGLERLT